MPVIAEPPVYAWLALAFAAVIIGIWQAILQHQTRHVCPRCKGIGISSGKRKWVCSYCWHTWEV